MNSLVNWIKDRAREKSTAAGVVAVLTAAASVYTGPYMVAVNTALAVLGGLGIGVTTKPDGNVK